MTSEKGIYLRRHKINIRERGRFSDYIKVDMKILEAITNMISTSEADVSWNLTAFSYYDSDRGIIENMYQKEGIIAYSDWKKWYNSWVNIYGVQS